MRVVALLACVTACGFSAGGGAAQGDDTPGQDAGSDGDTTPSDADAAITGTCMERWMNHTIRFTAPTPMSINSNSFDRDPFVTRDGKSLLISSGRPVDSSNTPPGGGADIFISTRANVTDPWPAPVRFAPFSTGFYDGKCSTALGDKVVFVSNSSLGDEDIFTATLSGGAWSSLSSFGLGNVNTFGHELDPFISDDALRLYIAPSDTGVPQHIEVAKRENTSQNLGEPTPIAELNAGPLDGDPTLTPDEKVILFYSTRDVTGVSKGGNDVWYATRASIDSTFDFVGIVPDINTDKNEGDPHISADGCHVYFGRKEAATDWDLYETTATQ